MKKYSSQITVQVVHFWWLLTGYLACGIDNNKRSTEAKMLKNAPTLTKVALVLVTLAVVVDIVFVHLRKEKLQQIMI